jgi:hypothetical protein
LNVACVPLFTFRIIHSRLRKEQLLECISVHEVIFKAILDGDKVRLKTTVKDCH